MKGSQSWCLATHFGASRYEQLLVGSRERPAGEGIRTGELGGFSTLVTPMPFAHIINKLSRITSSMAKAGKKKDPGINLPQSNNPYKSGLVAQKTLFASHLERPLVTNLHSMLPDSSLGHQLGASFSKQTRAASTIFVRCWATFAFSVFYSQSAWVD